MHTTTVLQSEWIKHMNIRSAIFTCTLAMGMLFSSLSHADPVWIDVRTLVEHTIDNIEGDVRISYSDIVEGVNKLYPDKETDIRLYCRSGGRAGVALSALEQAGYRSVQNVGSIDDARRLRGIPVE